MPEVNWDQFFKEFRQQWRRYLGRYIRSFGTSRAQIEAPIKFAFECELKNQYSIGLLDAKNRAEQTKADLARRYGGVHRAQITRWFDDKHFKSFEAFCFVSAGEDVEFPRGHHVALHAYDAAWRVWGELSGRSFNISWEQTLCLYYMFRMKEYVWALATSNSKSQNEGAALISNWLREELDDSKRWSVAELQQLWRGFGRDWQVIDEVLGYDWF